MIDRLDKGALQYARDLIELVSVMRLSLRLCGLKKLIIDCLARGRHVEVDFALKTIRRSVSAHPASI